MALTTMTAEQIEMQAGAVITDYSMYAKNLPKLGGLADPGMGSCDRRVRCTTCRGSFFSCQGHTGVIRLPIHLYNPANVEMVYRLLQGICFACAQLLGTPAPTTIQGDKAPIAKFDAAVAAGKNKFTCRFCGVKQPKYSKAPKSCNISWSWTPKRMADLAEASPALAEMASMPFTPTMAYEILDAISKDTMVELGMDPDLSPPSAMIMVNICVLPPNARPAIMAAEGSKRKGQDDITTQLQDTVKACLAIRKAVSPHPATGSKVRLTPDACPEFDYTIPHVPSSIPLPIGPSSATAPASAYTYQSNAAFGNRRNTSHAHHTAQMLKAAANASVAATVTTRSPIRGNWSSAGVQALRRHLHGAAPGITATQAAAIWGAHPALCERLQNEVTVVINNGGKFAPQAKQRTQVARRSLDARMNGKTGRLRCNVFAKRSDQTARAVIQPDKELDPDQLGVPQNFMNTLTKFEEVHLGNVQRLQQAVDKGSGVSGGAARILTKAGHLIQLHLLKDGKRPRIVPGDIVERHLVDGDAVTFNRQPTLHRLSIMVHRAKAVPGRAFRVPLCVMKPYNADCDGDEMNIHVVQSIEAEAEARILMAISANIINPQNGAPCLGLVQDGLVGAYLLTRNTTRLTLRDMNVALGAINYPWPGKSTLPEPFEYSATTGEPLWTGRQVVTALLPPGIHMHKHVRGLTKAEVESSPRDSWSERLVVIEDGVHVSGALCKATLGTTQGGLVHQILHVAGPRAVIHFLGDFQRVIYAWLPLVGVSIGLKDCMVPDYITSTIKKAVNDADAVVESLSKDAHALKDTLTVTERANIEADMLKVLTSVLDYVSRLVLNEGVAECGLRHAVVSGSKGNINNVGMVTGCLGQQIVDSDRLKPCPVSGRTLPCFPPGAFSAVAQGFIANNYLTGLNAAEFWSHSASGREGIVATAVMTARTGYNSRTMLMGMQAHGVAWDGTVRNAQNYIIEYVAGGDMLSSTAVERVSVVDLMSYPHAAMAELTDLEIPPHFSGKGFLKVRDDLQEALNAPCLALGPECGPNRILLAMDPKTMLKEVGANIAAGVVRPNVGDAATDEELVVAVQAIILRVCTANFYCPASWVALWLITTWEWRPSALRDAGIGSVEALEATLGTSMLSKVQKALIQPGESVGAIAAQSIGEPSTQFTLNVFHQAGLLQRRLTMGMPRLIELLHATVRIRTAAMKIPFAMDHATGLLGGFSSELARDRATRSLEFLALDTVAHSSYVMLDDPKTCGDEFTTVYKDIGLMQHVHRVFGPEGDDVSPWVVRVTLNRSLLNDHGFTPETVARAVATQLSSYRLSLVYSEANMRRWVLRVRVCGDPSERTARDLHAAMRSGVLLGGIPGIKSAHVISMVRMVRDDATGALKKETVPMVDVDGCSLKAIATRDWLDWEHCIVNDVVEVARVLGIVAARAVLYAELEKVISYDGGYVDPRHLGHVVASMTHRGTLMPFTRHGINRINTSFIQRSAYEESSTQWSQAAMLGTRDPLTGVSEAVMMGTAMPLGTGSVAVRDVANASFFQPGQDAPRQPVAPPRVMVVSRETKGLPGAVKRFRRHRGDMVGTSKITKAYDAEMFTESTLELVGGRHEVLGEEAVPLITTAQKEEEFLAERAKRRKARAGTNRDIVMGVMPDLCDDAASVVCGAGSGSAAPLLNKEAKPLSELPSATPSKLARFAKVFV